MTALPAFRKFLQNSSNVWLYFYLHRFDATKKIVFLRGEKLNYKSVAKEVSKPLFFLAPEVQWASKFTVFVLFTFPLNVSNHTHFWYVT